MIDVRSRRCSHESCTKISSFNVMGNRTAAYCKQHAEDDMVDVHSRRCSEAFCTKQPSFNFVESKTARYCKLHAADGMVNVIARHCLRPSCFKRPAWGVLTDDGPTSCLRHKGDILDRPVINFRALCKVAGCKSSSCWGLDGKQPTHCRSHGPLMVGLVCTVERPRSKRTCRNPSFGVARCPSFRVKTECLF